MSNPWADADSYNKGLLKVEQSKKSIIEKINQIIEIIDNEIRYSYNIYIYDQSVFNGESVPSFHNIGIMLNSIYNALKQQPKQTGGKQLYRLNIFIGGGALTNKELYVRYFTIIRNILQKIKEKVGSINDINILEQIKKSFGVTDLSLHNFSAQSIPTNLSTSINGKSPITDQVRSIINYHYKTITSNPSTSNQINDKIDNKNIVPVMDTLDKLVW